MDAAELKVAVIKEITKGTERDKQRRIGPSGIGNVCPRCLAQDLLHISPERDFSLYPWLGTAGHAYLEDNTFPDEMHEMKLYVGDIEGYGEIRGTTDMWMRESRTVVDWKFVGLKKIKEYRVKGPPPVYRYQGHIYGNGIHLLPDEPDPENIAIVFIPRDSGNVNDIFVHMEQWQPEMVEAAFSRAALVLKTAQEKGWETLPSSDDCYNCKMSW